MSGGYIPPYLLRAKAVWRDGDRIVALRAPSCSVQRRHFEQALCPGPPSRSFGNPVMIEPGGRTARIIP